MSGLLYKDLLTRVTERLSATSVETDHLLLTRWRVLGLAQYLAGKPVSEAEKLSVAALELFIREGPGKPVDDALQRARKAVAMATSTSTLSVLPSIASEIREDVLCRLQKFKTLGNAAIEQAIDILPTLRERLRKSPVGALLSGLLHRVELVATTVENDGCSDEQRINAASAILYLNEIHDVIPDTLGLIGLLDDDFALRVVLDELAEHTEDEKLHWAERICAIWEDLPFLQGVLLLKGEESIVTTWLDRINSYVSYLHALDGPGVPLVLVQPSIACSPLHTIVSLIGLLILDGLTSSQDLIRSLHKGQVYEIDGKFRAQYDGLTKEDDPHITGWLRLTFRNGTIIYHPTIADRMVPVANNKLSSANAFSKASKDDTELIQRFFGWDEAIGAASIVPRVLLVTSRQRAVKLFGEVESNGVSLLNNSLIRFGGLNPSPDVVRTALVLVVPTLRVARELIEKDTSVHAVLIDGYQRLRHGRHDLPFLLSSKFQPSIIVWSFIGYYPDELPNWLPETRQLEVGFDDLSSILELDGNLDKAMAPARESLWEAATGGKIKHILVPRENKENSIIATIEEFLEIVRTCEGLPNYWKYQLFSFATALRSLVSGTACYWSDIQEFVREWDIAFDEQWGELRSHAAKRLTDVAESRQRISSAVSNVTSEMNSKASALIVFYNSEKNRDWYVVCDRQEQVRITSRLARCESLQLKPVMLRDLDVCQDCIIIGWRSKSFARKLQAHTPRQLFALADEREWRRWEFIEIQGRKSKGESLLGTVGHQPRPPVPQSDATDEFLFDDEPNWESEEILSEERENQVPCIFIWLAGEPSGKILARNSRVLVKSEEQVYEKPAHRIVPEDEVILGLGSKRWSPADEFTQAVVQAVEASHPQLVRDAREWRIALSKLKNFQGWTVEELRNNLEKVEIHREIQTLEIWLQLDQAAPIAPRHFQKELLRLWQLVGEHAERNADEVMEACRHLRSLRQAASRVLLKLWKGSTISLGIDETRLEELAEQLKQQVQVYIIDSVTYGEVPSYMLGWWIIPELAESFEIPQNSSVSSDVELEMVEDDLWD